MGARANQGLSEPQRKLVEDACARHLDVELHYEEEDGFKTAGLRLVTINNAGIALERPKDSDCEISIHADTTVRVYLPYEQDFYAFSGRVLRVVEATDPEGQTHVTGVIVSLPEQLDKEQRRQDFRVMLTHANLGVTLHELVTGEELAAPLRARQYPGKLFNVSRGGVAVTFETPAVAELEPSQRWFLLFTLPDAPDPVLLAVRKRYHRPSRKSRQHIVGFLFADVNNLVLRPYAQRVDNYIAAEQRAQLRRRTMKR